ncbi:alkaline phosphatase family protein [Microbacterium sp. NPDC055903]
MPLMLPTESATARSIVGVADELLGAVRGAGPSRLRSGVLVLVDGLGAIPLRAHAGHARSLTAGMSRRDVAVSVFPSTTAAALTSILTGAWPGEHGLVGYRVLDRDRDVLVNQLTDWESAGIDPLTWQPRPTVFERASADGHPAFALGVAAYAQSGFTRATLRGAAFVAEQTAADRVRAAYTLAAENDGAFVYCYLPEVDKAGHRYGIDSGEWVAALEEIDAALSIAVPDGVGVVITADHGMLDVPAHRQIVFDETDGVREMVRHFGGEPRMLHLYLHPGVDADHAAASWRRATEGIADVATRSEALASGLFGPRTTSAASERVGDLVVAARGNRALYDGTAADQRGRGMIGQHGSLTPEERLVPLIMRGALAR